MAYFSLSDPARGSRNNPFRTYSNFIYPRTIDEALIWAMWFWERNAKYRNAVQKTVSYFVSDITCTQTDTEATDIDNRQVQDFEDLLRDSYNVLTQITHMGIELAAMGNLFVSAERVFTRQLLCPTKGCGWIMNLKALHKGVEYDWDGEHFVGVCPQCGKQVKFKIKDVEATDADGRKVRFIMRDPKDMHIQYNVLTDTYKYMYKMPSYIKDAIKRGDAVYLQDSPRVYLEAANNDAYIEFPEENFFHMRTQTLTGLDRLYKGWGIPLFMTSFDNFIRLQHLDKFNEAVTMDYIAPTRMISPQPGNLKAGIDDPNRMPISGYQFKSFMQESLRRVKENPTTWIVSPVPVQYQMLGGEAKQMAPVDLMEWYVTQILSDMGIPQEFRQTQFQVAAPTMGLRFFERQWIHFAKGLNQLTRWMGQRIADAHNKPNMVCTLDVTSFAEDDMNKQMLFGLMQGQVISKTKILQSMGVDYEEDAKQRIREQRMEEDLARDLQTDAQDAEMIQSVMPP